MSRIRSNYNKPSHVDDWKWALGIGGSKEEDRLRVKMLTELVVKKQIEEEQVTYKDRQIAISKQAAFETGKGRNKVFGEFRGRIDSRTYARWEQAIPGCWNNKEFVDKYFRDNPEADVNKFR